MRDIEAAFVRGLTDELEKLGGVVSQVYGSAKAHPFIAGLIIGHLATRAGKQLKKIVRGTRE